MFVHLIKTIYNKFFTVTPQRAAGTVLERALTVLRAY